LSRKNVVVFVLSLASLSVYAFWAMPASAQTPHIVSTSPAQNELNVPVSGNITVTFDMEMVQLPLPRRSVYALGDVVYPASCLYRNGPPSGCS